MNNGWNLRLAIVAMVLVSGLMATKAADAAGPTTKDFGQWRVSCSGSSCQTHLTLAGNLPGSGKQDHFLTLSFYYTGTDRTKVTSLLKLPLGLAIAPGVRLGFGKDESVKYALEVCYPDGCNALSLYDAAALAKFNGVATATVYFFTYSKGQQLAVNVPMSGLADALAYMKTQPAKP